MFIDIFYRRDDTDGRSVFTNDTSLLIWGDVDWTGSENVEESNLVDYRFETYHDPAGHVERS